MRWFATLVAVALGACNWVFGLEPPAGGGDDDVAVDGPVTGGGTDGGGEGFAALVAGADHTCVSRGRTVWCWGAASSGQLGLGNTNNIGDNEPASAAAGVTLEGEVIMLAAGGDHTCALRTGGEVSCWGAGARGQLGYGNTTNVGDNESPVLAGAVPIGPLAASVEAGDQHTCVTTAGLAVRCWGAGSDGRLGYGNTTDIGDDEAPSSVGDVPGLPEYVGLAAGATHTCGLDSNHSVTCWGSGLNGQLGYGNVNNVGDNELPGLRVTVGLEVSQVVAGDSHTCALLINGAVRCWGMGSGGRLGYGDENNLGDNEEPDLAGDINLGGAAVQLAAGGAHTCAILDNGAVRCWGRNDKGQLGYGNGENIGDNEAPLVAGDVLIGDPAVRITAGAAHTCVELASGEVLCWGAGGSGQLGYGNTDDVGDNETPASVGAVPL